MLFSASGFRGHLFATMDNKYMWFNIFFIKKTNIAKALCHAYLQTPGPPASPSSPPNLQKTLGNC